MTALHKRAQTGRDEALLQPVLTRLASYRPDDLDCEDRSQLGCVWCLGTWRDSWSKEYSRDLIGFVLQILVAPDSKRAPLVRQHEGEWQK